MFIQRIDVLINIYTLIITTMDRGDAIYEELKAFSGPHTNLGNVSKVLTGHDVYGSYHFPNFNKTHALRNTLTRFDEFLVPATLVGKKIFDIGSCIGSLSFECARRGADQVIGFEYCAERVNVCNKLAQHLCLNNIRFEQANIDEIDKNTDMFLQQYGQADVVFCCALDAYVDRNRLYEFVSKITKTICLFETNSKISEEEFIAIMEANGFQNIIVLGTSRSDPGYGRYSYILVKENKLAQRFLNTVYDHETVRVFDSVVTVLKPFNNTKDLLLREQFKNYYRNLIQCYEKVKHIKYMAPYTFFGNAYSASFYSMPLHSSKLDKKIIKEQIIDLIREMNTTGIAHRDLHIGNVYVHDSSIMLTDIEFLCENKVPLDRSYDLTGQGEESPLATCNMHIFSSNGASFFSFLNGTLTLSDFIDKNN